VHTAEMRTTVVGHIPGRCIIVFNAVATGSNKLFSHGEEQRVEIPYEEDGYNSAR
jgi:hypothetical protein